EIADDLAFGMHFQVFVGPDWRTRARRFYDVQYMRRRPSSYLELPIVSMNGRERWIGHSVQLIFDGREVLGFQVIARDITDRIALDNKLKESETRFRTLIEHSTDMITIIGADG